MGPQVRAAELLLCHEPHHRLDGDGVGHAVRGEAVGPAVVGVGELPPGVLTALAGVEAEVDVPALVHQWPRGQPLGLDERPVGAGGLVLARLAGGLVVSGGQTGPYSP